MRRFLPLLFILLVPTSFTYAAPTNEDGKKPFLSLPDLPPIGGVIGLPGQVIKNGDGNKINNSVSSRPNSSKNDNIYRQILPNGSVIYTDTPITGIKIEKKLSSGQSKNGIQISNPKYNGNTSGSAVVNTESEISSERIKPTKQEAEAAYRDALSAQKNGSTPLVGERHPTQNKNSSGGRITKLDESFLNRQEDLELAVQRAKNTLDSIK
jgi:hypothetical protein